MGATLRKNLGSPMPKPSDDSCLQEAVGNMHVFVACQIDVVNKQLVSPLSWNDPESETSWGKSYILMLYKHLDTKKKHYLDVDGAYNM